MKRIAFIITLFGVTFCCNGQVLAPKSLHFNTDSATQASLVIALNGFLDQKEKPNKENKFILKEDLLTMSALLDELKGIDKNVKLKDDHFYKPFLQNLADVGNNNFFIQLSYIGSAEGQPVLRASFNLIAKRDSGRFYFYSVLSRNTTGWKTNKIGSMNCHFKDTLYTSEVKAYLKFVALYNQKLKIKTEPIDFYECGDFIEAERILGIDYKADYTDMLYNDFTSHENGATLEVNGRYTTTSLFDRHDLWHDRLHMVLSTDKINRPVDEGCAYLYGGSWGATWPEVVATFKKYAADHPDADWLKLYQGNVQFNADPQKPFYIAYFINALIVQKIEKEKGFTPIMDLLACGKREAGEDNYFKALEKVSGISKADFNKTVWQLIKTNQD